MARLLIRRLLLIPLVLIGVTVAVQMLYLLLPGDPAVTLAGGESASVSEIERIRQELNLDAPFYVAYWDWLKDAIHLNFGVSLVSGAPVSAELLRRLPATLSIGLLSLFIAVPMGVAGGLLAAVKRGSWFDRTLLAVTSAGMAVPAFILAILAVVFVSITLELLPATGYTPLTESPTQWFSHVILPASALALQPASRIARTLRGSMLTSLDGPYVLTAWAKGAAPKAVLGKHALKNSMIPTVTVLGLDAAQLLGGAVVVESVFAIPGVGRYVADAAVVADIPVIQACAVLFAVVTVLATLAVDVAYGFLNPKVRVA